MVTLPARTIRLMILVAAAALTLSCVLPFVPVLSPDKTGTLTLDIDYTGTFYREVFEYTHDAPNIRHLVLIVPQDRQNDVNPGAVFHALLFTGPGEAFPPDVEPALEYVYDAPGAAFAGEFEPGDYALAVAFLAGPITKEEAGVPEDTILYAGITGGGASTGFQPITITPGETTAITVTMTDDNGWACPWLYVFDGTAFVRTVEILRNLNDPRREQTEITHLGLIRPVDGAIIVKIAEEKDETTYLDALYLVIDGVPVDATADPAVAARLTHDDGEYLILQRGESVTLSFPLSAPADVSVVAAGYYVPSPR